MPISTKMLPRPLLDAIKRSPGLYSLGRRARFNLGSLLGARSVPGVGRVHFNDFMLDSTRAPDVEHYSRGARQFVGILDRALEEAGRSWDDVNSVLEIGCGYGRIVRELRSQHPKLDIYVNDVMDEGAQFTAREFNARQIPLLESSSDQVAAKFDLIYLLSVYTHMPRDMIERNLGLLSAALRPRGVVVFTIHGEGSARTAERYEQYWLDKTRVLRALADDGYYYERYPYYRTEYGLTWFTPEAVSDMVSKAAPALEQVSHHPMELDGHQDIYVYRRSRTA